MWILEIVKNNWKFPFLVPKSIKYLEILISLGSFLMHCGMENGQRLLIYTHWIGNNYCDCLHPAAILPYSKKICLPKHDQRIDQRIGKTQGPVLNNGFGSVWFGILHRSFLSCSFHRKLIIWEKVFDFCQTVNLRFRQVLLYILTKYLRN